MSSPSALSKKIKNMLKRYGPINCQVLENSVHVQIELNENGGVFNHYTNVTYAETTETNINSLVDEIMAAAFPTATVVE